MLVHVEVQTQRAIGFPERMFVYHYRIRDRFGARCAAFGILADDDPGWRPGEFRDELLGTELVMRFRTAKLTDYEVDLQALESDDNPFALVVMQQGMQQGELSGRAATVQRLLARRLGVLSKEDEQRIRSLSITMLDLLADDLLDFTEPADLQRWFARYVSQ